MATWEAPGGFENHYLNVKNRHDFHNINILHAQVRDFIVILDYYITLLNNRLLHPRGREFFGHTMLLLCWGFLTK